MRLFIIGNGFDKAHNLNTDFDPDFKIIANKYELYNFWDIYQTQDDNIWSDFENNLAHHDFNSLEEIFTGCRDCERCRDPFQSSELFYSGDDPFGHPDRRS